MILSTLGNTLIAKLSLRNESVKKHLEYTWDKPVVVMHDINSQHSSSLVNGFRQSDVV